MSDDTFDDTIQRTWTELLARAEQLRAAHDGLRRQFADLEKRHAELVDYNNEMFSENAEFTGDIHRALGLHDDEDFLSNDEYVAKIIRLRERLEGGCLEDDDPAKSWKPRAERPPTPESEPRDE